MLSRIADSLFWLNRYMERSDCLMRVIRTNYILAFDSGTNASFTWKDVVTLCAYTSDEQLQEVTASENAALHYLINDAKNFNSIKVLISKARENARGVQDNITKEVWEQVNQLYLIINDPALPSKITGSHALEVIDELDQNNTLFYGVTDSTMPRGQGWNFMNLGKFIERSILTIDITYAHFQKINHQLGQSQDILFWRNLLISLSGYELYLKKYTRAEHNISVIEHIIFNQDFPRSLIYSLSRVKRYLNFITTDAKIEGVDQLQKTFGRIISKVEFADMDTIKETSLPNYLYNLRNDLVNFSNQLTRIYFSYA